MLVELVVSRVRPGASHEDCLELARHMRSFLKLQPGFVSHELYVAENMWAHRVVWRSFEEASKAQRALSETEMAWEMSELVQPDQQTFLGRRIDDL
jgi:heme-degrading monooxygenase HmoA